jgi:hypothetical protein
VIGASAIGAQRLRLWGNPRSRLAKLITTMSITLDEVEFGQQVAGVGQ